METKRQILDPTWLQAVENNIRKEKKDGILSAELSKILGAASKEEEAKKQTVNVIPITFSPSEKLL